MNWPCFAAALTHDIVAVSESNGNAFAQVRLLSTSSLEAVGAIGARILSTHSPRLARPTGILVCGSNLYVADAELDSLQRCEFAVDVDGAVETSALEIVRPPMVQGLQHLGHSVFSWSPYGLASWRPGGLATTAAADGQRPSDRRRHLLFVSDSKNHRVVALRCDEGHSLHSAFGGFGESPGCFDHPRGIAVDPRAGRQRVIVADRGNDRLQVASFGGASADGAGSTQFLGVLGEHGRAPGQLLGPYAVAFVASAHGGASSGGASHHLLVSEFEGRRVQVLDTDSGEPLQVLRLPDALASGKWACPTAIAPSHDGRHVFVASFNAHRIHEYAVEGLGAKVVHLGAVSSDDGRVLTAAPNE